MRTLLVVTFAAFVAGCGSKGEADKPVAKADAPSASRAKEVKPPKPNPTGPNTGFGGGGLGDLTGGTLSKADKPGAGGLDGFGSIPDVASQMFKKDKPTTEDDFGDAELKRLRQIVAELEEEQFFAPPLCDPNDLSRKKGVALKAELRALVARPDPKPHDVTAVITKVAPRYTRREIEYLPIFYSRYRNQSVQSHISAASKEAFGFDLADTNDANRFGKMELDYRKQNNAAGLKFLEEVRDTWNRMETALAWHVFQDRQNMDKLLKKVKQLKPGK